MASKESKDDKKKRRRLAKYRFKTIVRKVMINIDWMNELEEQKMGDNVRRNVAIIVRRKGTKGTLTIEEKALLNTPVETRTPEIIQNIYLIILSLRCFHQYSKEVKLKLAASTYYLYYNRGRIIIRENHFASALYFILSGEITILMKKFVITEQCLDDVAVGSLGPGDLFGEVALLFGTKRTATFQTATDTELLCVYKEDFNDILKSTLLTQWENVNAALNRFSYFDKWTVAQRRECYSLSRVKQYAAQSIIYSEDNGLLTPVHFLLSGSCQILQCLKMTKKIINNQSYYKLDSIETSKKASELRMKTKRKASILKNEQTDNKRESVENLIRSVTNFNVDELYKNITTKKFNKSEEKDTFNNSNEHIFIDVGSYACGSVFGLGEEMSHRTVIAKSQVQCLVVPRYWLFQKEQNIGNIWQRTKLYLDTTIPSREKCFDDFLLTKKWQKYRKDMVKHLVSMKTIGNTTRLCDVPTICRIEEGE